MTLDQKKIAEYYNKKTDLWPTSDAWHWKTNKYISTFIDHSISLPDKAKLLNAGSGGNNYNLPEEIITHVDIAENLIEDNTKKIVASIEDIPLEDNSFTNIVCVGSVLNYCDPILVIKEFKRILKPQGQLILEFEKSDTLELIFSKDFGKPSVLRKTFYDGSEEIIWYFSEKYIKRLLSELDFRIDNLKRFHLTSAMIYGFTKREKLSSKFTVFDKLLFNIPKVKTLSSNVILQARLIE